MTLDSGQWIMFLGCLAPLLIILWTVCLAGTIQVFLWVGNSIRIYKQKNKEDK